MHLCTQRREHGVERGHRVYLGRPHQVPHLVLDLHKPDHVHMQRARRGMLVAGVHVRIVRVQWVLAREEVWEAAENGGL